MQSAIRADKVSKCYSLSAQRSGGYRTLRESIMTALTTSWRRRKPSTPTNGAADNGILWALRDVSFEVKPGETVGIIGRNGAGKSTLLKVLSRITEPHSGRIELRGRVGSLLEVGTGFHPELTGRENIFLSGTILGMTRHEIRRRFDEIVAFAEIDRFLDTPVKRYSSGMYVRLAFAVAAHLEPEILVVDEVLAVGDVIFQKKCLSKMRDVGRDGRTVLFVSHNMTALQALCSRGLLLRQGTLSADGTIEEAVADYLKGLEKTASTDLQHRTDRGGAAAVRLVRVEVQSGGHEAGRATMGEEMSLAFHLSSLMPGLICLVNIFDQYGYLVTRFNSGFGSLEDTCDADIGPTFVCTIEEMLLAPGRYRIDVGLQANGEWQDHIEAAAFFEVARGTVRGREVPRSEGDWKFCMPHRWQSPG
jgi:lipopolysaccharide transport system ATP-binding protein